MTNKCKVPHIKRSVCARACACVCVRETQTRRARRWANSDKPRSRTIISCPRFTPVKPLALTPVPVYPWKHGGQTPVLYAKRENKKWNKKKEQWGALTNKRGVQTNQPMARPSPPLLRRVTTAGLCAASSLFSP